MKKSILFTSVLFFLLIALPSAYAGECEKITDVDDYHVKIISGVNVRDKVCDGNVIGSLATGKVVKVTGEIEGWRHVELEDGSVGFIWSDFVEVTQSPSGSSASSNEPKTLSDISGHSYATAINYLVEKDVVQGYPDGSYQPNRTVNRAEFIKILVAAKQEKIPKTPFSNCFPDVPKDQWFAPYVCYAKEQGIIGGYPDNTFRPGNTINLVEAAKILVNTLELSGGSDYPSNPWYRPYVEVMQKSRFLPDTFNALEQNVTRGQMAEMMWRVLEEKKDQPSKTFKFPADDFSGSDNDEEEEVACFTEAVPANVDMDEIRAAWVVWHNEARTDEARSALGQHDALDYSGAVWAKANKVDGEITHDRPAGQSLLDWFTETGVGFKQINGMIYGENLGWGTYRCQGADCTEELKTAIKGIFDAFMAEKGTSYTGHYDNIVEEDFTVLGLGIAIDEEAEEFFLTAHYAAGIEKNPINLCSR